jgi:hypothetical protein
MDPDGANRIVKQQIKEWYAERREDRYASLLEPASPAKSWSIIGTMRRVLAAVTIAGSSLRRREPDQRVAQTLRVTEPPPGLAEEPLS